MMQRERVVHDETEPCPYLEAEQARMPLRWQLRPLSSEELDGSLAMGDRRVGRMLYRTACPSCHACEPLRLPVQDFVPSRSQRRIWKRNRDLRIELAPATFDQRKLDLFNRHKLERGLSKSGRPMSSRGYKGWFTETCAETIEMRYLQGDHLLGLGVLDLGRHDTSSVYFFFDPDASKRSLGVFSCIFEVMWLRRRGGRHHYLGLFVSGCPQLSYKAEYYPHERLIDGAWHRFERRGADPVLVEP